MCLTFLILSTKAQTQTYKESEVPAYKLPEVFRMADGTVISDKSFWEVKRRPEVLTLFTNITAPLLPPHTFPQPLNLMWIWFDNSLLQATTVKKRFISNGAVFFVRSVSLWVFFFNLHIDSQSSSIIDQSSRKHDSCLFLKWWIRRYINNLANFKVTSTSKQGTASCSEKEGDKFSL
jgi:hypothetical protein